MVAKKETKEQRKYEPTLDELFDYRTMNLEIPFLPVGAVQLTPVQIKFDTIGMILMGVYMGYSTNISSYDTTKEYHFHKVMLPSGVVIGFSGSTQLDGVLCGVTPRLFEVRIEYTEDKDNKRDNRLKFFNIIARKIDPLRYNALPPETTANNETGEVCI